MTMKLVVDNSGNASKRYSNSSGGNGGDDGMKDLERRVTNLESNVQAIREDIHGIKVDLAVVKTRVDNIADNMATKADLLEVKNDLTRWMISTLLTGIGLASAIVFGIMKVFPSQPPEVHVQLAVPDKAIQVVAPGPATTPPKAADSPKK